MKRIIFALLILLAPLSYSAEHYYKIDPTGSNFTYEELATITRQNFGFISQFSNHTFAPLSETDQEPAFTERVIRFSPTVEFPPNILALARRGVDVNIERTAAYDREEMRCLILHELGHNTGLAHVPILESIMSAHRFKSGKSRCLPWRSDIARWHKYHAKEGEPTPVARVTISGDLTVRIPALTYEGKQIGVTLRHLYDKNFVASSYYAATEGIQMIEKAFLESETELVLYDANYLGTTWPTPLRFVLTPPRNYFVLQPLGAE